MSLCPEAYETPAPNSDYPCVLEEGHKTRHMAAHGLTWGVAHRYDIPTFYHGEFEQLFPQSLDDLRIGDFYWFNNPKKRQRSLIFIMPDGPIPDCPMRFDYMHWIIPVTHADVLGRRYDWNGNVRYPTIIGEQEYTYIWRGFIRAGKLEANQ